MLNIAQTQQEIKTQFATAARPAPNLHTWTGINQAYRELKALGWQHVDLHPVERVPVFRLADSDAYLWRDKSFGHDWVVQVNGSIYGVDGDLADITADCRAASAPQVTTLAYDRQAREWVATNALESQRFPAGPDGHRQAELYALAHDVPAIAAEVEALIETANALYMFDRAAITSRAIKAGFILRDGKMWPGQAPGEVARVNGTADAPYSITTDGQRHYCDCPDFVGERAPVLPNGEIACKHIMAVQIAAALEESPMADGEIDF